MPTRSLQFKVVASIRDVKPDANLVVLVEDAWDDWFTFSTMYSVFYYDELEELTRIGSVKIGKFGMGNLRRPNIPSNYETLDDSYFSLGQDDQYYDNLNKIGESFRQSFLVAMNDVAADLHLWARARKEPVTATSLLRSVSKTEVEGQFHRMTQGGARLTDFNFTYTGPKRDVAGDRILKLAFEVESGSYPPTNVHVVIGRNGVGKTHTMNLMTKALVAKPSVAAQSGRFVTTEGLGQSAGAPFSNLVSVCFSAFDSFLLGRDELDKQNKIAFSYVGLRRLDDEGKKLASPKSTALLASEFVKSMIECSVGSRFKRWQRAVQTLESDPIFAAAQVGTLIDGIQRKERQEEVKEFFKKRLSSGHQIVLLSITKLVQTVEERSLVLLDEPEGHLHPPLLSAFVRALSDLLIDRNGVAIIATHSPVVLQEVPQSCVWKLQRSGTVAIAERPDCQTFGENVGILTREVFGFEVTDSGFHRMLREVAEKVPTFDRALTKFKGELGAEARAMLRVMYLRKEASHEDAD